MLIRKFLKNIKKLAKNLFTNRKLYVIIQSQKVINT
nr:MAG TPA: hypothetical protein [Caudoviricetes sp.]